MIAELPPLICFVHVPKAGGNSVKGFLQRAAIGGIGQFDRIGLLNVPLERMIWGTSHDPRWRWEAAIEDRRQRQYFASVRDPKARIISNLNMNFDDWRDPNASRPQSAKALCEAILAANWDCPRDVLAVLVAAGPRLLNAQSYYLFSTPDMDRGAPPRLRNEDEIASELQRYDFIATFDALPAMCRSFGFYSDDEFDRLDPADFHRNGRDYLFDRAVFDDPLVADYIDERTVLEERAYSIARQIFVDTPPNRMERRMFRDHDTLPFNEERYFQSYPDVAKAVESDAIQSGYFHYVRHGRFEGRLRYY